MAAPSKNAGTLLLVAAVLFAFIWFFERHLRPPQAVLPSAQRLLPFFAPGAVQKIVVRHESKTFVLNKTDGVWTIVSPAPLEGETSIVEGFLGYLSRLSPPIHIPAEVVTQQPGGSAEYGMADPEVTFILESPSERIELRVGNTTPSGDHVYLQRVGTGGIFVAPSEFLGWVPNSINDWRKRNLIAVDRRAYDRIQVNAAGKKFEFEKQGDGWLLKPRLMRADESRVEQFLQKLHHATIAEFLSPERAETEELGLNPPSLEMTFLRQTNSLFAIQFGKSPPGQSNLVYVRNVQSPAEIMLAHKSVVDSLFGSTDEWLERRPFTFQTSQVQQIEFLSETPFKIRKEGNQSWKVVEPETFPADVIAVTNLIHHVSRLEVAAFVKDVVGDPAEFGLAAPSLEVLFSGGSNGGETNTVLRHLQIGKKDEKFYARQAKADPVYEISQADRLAIPNHPWQVRHRSIWSFTTNQVQKVTIRQKGRTRVIQRNAAGKLSIAPGSSGSINVDALSETLYRLGRLEAFAWLGKGPEAKARFPFSEHDHQVVLEIKSGETVQTLQIEFAVDDQSFYPYASVTLDGEIWVFAFPPDLYHNRVSEDLVVRTQASFQPSPIPQGTF